MKTAAPDIDHAHLIDLINGEYNIAIDSLRFVPKGEEAYVYIGQTQNEERYFVRAQPHAPTVALDQTYTITHALHRQHGLHQVVAPIATQQHTYTLQFRNYTVAVFPFIAGRTVYEQSATDADLRAAAMLLAAVHQSPPSVVALPLRKESFDNPFRTPILHALAVAENEPVHATAYQQDVCRLLTAERADMLATLERMQRMQAQAQTLPIDWIVTHGDPNLDNFLKDGQGTLHLTDWGEVALGPPERDLFSFTGDSFAVFLQHYATFTGNLTLHLDLFTFYFYRWTMQEIADYATRILFKEFGPIEVEHAWAELQPYLPIRHMEIAQGVQNVQNVIEHVLS
jgi:thiamine kinase-like enzyme